MKLSYMLEPSDLVYGDKVMYNGIEYTYLCEDLVGNPLIQRNNCFVETAKWSWLKLPETKTLSVTIKDTNSEAKPD